MRPKTLLISGLAGLAMLVSACGPLGAKPAPNQIVLADYSFPDSVNPLFLATVTDATLADTIWGFPVVLNSSMQWVPDQLVEVPTQQNGDVSSDGLTVTMKLRHDLKWSDGKAITSADFLYGWNTLMDSNTGANPTGFDQIQSITTPDANTVVLHYAQPFGAYLSYLPYALPQHSWSSISNANLVKTDSVNIDPSVNSGPYEVKTFSSGQSYTLVPNPNYHSQTFHTPSIAKITFTAYKDEDTLIAAVKAGQVDVTHDFSVGDLSKLTNLPSGFSLSQPQDISYNMLSFDNGEALFQGNSGLHLRLAIAESIDRCQIITQVLKQTCSQYLANTVEPKPAVDFDSKAQPPSFNLDAAKQDMQAAGYALDSNNKWAKSGKELSLRMVTESGNDTNANVGQQIIKDLAAFGVSAQITTYPSSQLYPPGGVIPSQQYDLAIAGLTAPSDPDGNYAVFHSSQIPSSANPGGSNIFFVSDPVIDAALTNGRQTMDMSKRIPYYDQFQEQLDSQAYVLPLFTLPNISVVNKAIENYQPNPSQAGNEWNVADWKRNDV